jgi:peptidyl-dipeptidase A
MMELKEIQGFIENKVKEIEVIYKNLQLAYWEAALHGKKELYEEYGKHEIALKKFFNNPEDFKKVEEMNNQNIEDEIVSRQIKLLYDAYLSYQGDFSLMTEITNKTSAVEHKFNTWRAELAGKKLSDNELKEILTSSLDKEELKKVWEASKTKGSLVSKEVLEIVKLRNALAKSLGFRDFYEFSLEVNEQKEKEVQEIFLELEKLTDAPFRQLKEEIDSVLSKKYQVGKEELKPWHYGDFYFQEGPHIYEVNLDDYYKEDIVEKAC